MHIYSYIYVTTTSVCNIRKKELKKQIIISFLSDLCFFLRLRIKVIYLTF